MEAILIYFILTNGGGYREPMNVKVSEMSCGLEGGVAGILLNSLVNPGKISIPDPGIVGKHCDINITTYVQKLEPGQYHIATTELGLGVPIPYIGPDPHISEYFKRVKAVGTMPKQPSQMRIQK